MANVHSLTRLLRDGEMRMANIPVLDKAISRLMELDQESVFALADIAAERVRQVEGEGWTPSHDDRHKDRSMALASACYAMFASGSDEQRAATKLSGVLTNDGRDIPGWSAWLSLWPWDRKWWKPKSRHRDTVRAGALLVAELARLMRNAT